MSKLPSNVDFNQTEKPEPMGDNIGGALRSYIERIENLDVEKAALSGDIKDVYAEVKGSGLSVKVVRMLIARRKKDQAELDELDRLLSMYSKQLVKP